MSTYVDMQFTTASKLHQTKMFPECLDTFGTSCDMNPQFIFTLQLYSAVGLVQYHRQRLQHGGAIPAWWWRWTRVR